MLHEFMPIFSRAFIHSEVLTVPLLSKSKYLKALSKTVSSVV